MNWFQLISVILLSVVCVVIATLIIVTFGIMIIKWVKKKLKHRNVKG